MVSATVDYHRERSRHFLSLVDDELTRGELEEASNKVWGAAAHAIKAVAERRGWQHHAHALLEEAVDEAWSRKRAHRSDYIRIQYMTGFRLPSAVLWWRILPARW